MKKQIFADKRMIYIGLSLFILVGVFVVANRSQSQSIQHTPPILPTIRLSPSPTRPVGCVPLPKEKAAGRDASGSKTGIPAADMPSVTPIPFKNVHDLSPDAASKDKGEIIVFRCDGSFEKYLAGPDVDIKKSIPLGPGDIILNSVPPSSMMGAHKPRLPAEPSQLPGYPAPSSQTQVPGTAYPVP